MLTLRPCCRCGVLRARLDGVLICCRLLQHEGAAVPLHRRELRLLGALMPPNRARSLEEIVGLIWSDPDEEPEIPDWSIKTWCSKLRPRLEGTTLRIGAPRNRMLELGTRGQVYLRSSVKRGSES